MSIIGLPLGWIMWLMYQLVHNYAVALILFTIVTKLLMLPLSIKQQKSTIKMQLIQPKLQEIQNKYKNNPQKMNEELQALYAHGRLPAHAHPVPHPLRPHRRHL